MSVQVKLDTRGLDRLVRDLDPASLQKELLRAGFIGESEAKSNHKYQDRSGNLTNSAMTLSENPMEVTVGYSAEYAPYVEAWDPYLKPAMQKALARLRATLEDLFRRAQ